MGIVDKIDKFQHPTKIFGYKKVLGSGVLVDYGFKSYVRMDKSHLNNLEIIRTGEIISSPKDVVGLSYDILGKITAEYKLVERVLAFGEFGEFFNLKSDDCLWYSENPVKELYEARELIWKKHLVWKGVILYTKKRAGYFLKIYGNYYFLPQGESLSTYRAGMRDSSYLFLLKNSGLYLEALLGFLSNSQIYWANGVEFQRSVHKINSVGCLLEYSLVEQLLLFKAKNLGYKGKFGKNRVRSYLYETLGVYYKVVEPVIRGLDIVGKKVDLKGINLLLNEGLSLRENSLRGHWDEISLYQKVCLNNYNSMITKEEFLSTLYFLEVYCSLLEGLLDILVPMEFKINSEVFLNVEFSRVVDETLEKGKKYSSVSRRLVSTLGL